MNLGPVGINNFVSLGPLFFWHLSDPQIAQLRSRLADIVFLPIVDNRISVGFVKTYSNCYMHWISEHEHGQMVDFFDQEEKKCRMVFTVALFVKQGLFRVQTFFLAKTDRS